MKFWDLFAVIAAIGEPAVAAPYPAVSPTDIRQVTPAPDMLGTQAIPIRAERFVVNLTRAREDDSRNPRLQRLIAPARSDAEGAATGVHTESRPPPDRMDVGRDLVGPA